MTPDNPTTDAALLLALADGDADDNARFLFRQRYHPLLTACCRSYGLPEKEATALAEFSVARLPASLAATPSPRPFRETLRSLAADAVAEYRRGRPLAERAASALVDDLSHHLTGEEILARAASRQVREQVEPAHWLAFRLQTVDGRSAEETAAELDLGVGVVFKARRRIGQMLRDAVEALREGSTIPGEVRPEVSGQASAGRFGTQTSLISNRFAVKRRYLHRRGNRSKPGVAHSRTPCDRGRVPAHPRKPYERGSVLSGSLN